MEKPNRRKSVGHLTRTQKERLLDLMRERPRLRSGKFSENFTQKEGQRQWEEISEILNAIPGSQKDWRLWRKTWQDLQSKTKSKKANIRKSFNKTGGGPPPEPMDDFEEGVASLINENSVFGHEGVQESAVMITDSPELQHQISSNIGQQIEIDPSNIVILDQSLQTELPIPNQDEIDITIPPPPEYRNNEDNRKQKINMKTLLKEKLELKKQLNTATEQFFKDFIKVHQERNDILRELCNNLKSKDEETPHTSK